MEEKTLQQDDWRLEDILPHRPPMVLIDEVVVCDEASQTLTAAVTAKPGWCENWAAIEFMAQTAAALAGVIDRRERPGQPARPGFLLGSRRLVLSLERFTVGERYLVTARVEFSDGAAASFACEIRNAAGESVASATLNAFCPDDLARFMAEQRNETHVVETEK